MKKLASNVQRDGSEGILSQFPSALHPPLPGARLGRDHTGNPGWFLTDPARPGKFLQVHWLLDATATSVFRLEPTPSLTIAGGLDAHPTE
jgi:hypothetical protein